MHQDATVRSFPLMGAMLGLLACGAADSVRKDPAPASPSPAPATAPTTTSAPPRFTYDAKAPLDLRVDGEAHAEGDVSIQAVSFASPRGGRVPALIVVPASPRAGTKLAGVVLQHGMELDKTELLPDAVAIARAGAVALLPDAPDQRPAAMRTMSFGEHDHDPELWDETVVDLRRAADVLAARSDVDLSRLGFVGHSFGATMGAILSAVEPRYVALVLIGGSGSFTRIVRTSTTESLLAMRAAVPAPALERYLASMAPFDAEVYAAQQLPTAELLLQFGTYDSGVPRDEAERFAAAARGKKEVRSYPTGHFITSPDALRDRVAFLARRLALRAP